MNFHRSLIFFPFLVLCVSGCLSITQETRRVFDPAYSKVNGVFLEKRPLDRNAHNIEFKYAYPMPIVETVTVHNTWGFASAEREGTFLNNRRDRAFVSYHFAVDEKGAIQFLPCDISAWHAGDSGEGFGNRRSIGIEICRSRCTGNNENLYRKAEENGIRLAAWLLWKYNLTPDKLRKHQDWSGKYCPHRILSEKRWDEFRRKTENSWLEIFRNSAQSKSIIK